MKVRCLGQIIIALAFGVLAGFVDAEELGFPKSCVELQKMAPEPVPLDTFSNRDSVLFRLEMQFRTSAKGDPLTLFGEKPCQPVTPSSWTSAKGDSLTFAVWDTETGKWLARRTAPGVLPGNWQFSPDGKLLAVPTYGSAKVIQLWEVGAKDLQGVPQLKLIAELRRRNVSSQESPDVFSPRYAGCLAWTPDSKTLIAAYVRSLKGSDSQILFWSFTDKPNVLSDSPPDDREPKAWKPWAKLEFDAPVTLAVSPDNRTLAVFEYWVRPPTGYFFDLQTGQQREKFEFDRDRNVKDPNMGGAGAYFPEFAPDSKTLVVRGHRYFTLWNTDPPEPRVNMLRQDFSEIMGTSHHFAFTSDSRWLLTGKIAQNKDVIRRRGGLVQVRDAQTGDVRHEVGFPEKLGLLYRISDVPDDRVLLRFWSRKGYRQFLWHTEDLLRYAVEHDSLSR